MELYTCTLAVFHEVLKVLLIYSSTTKYY